MRAFLWQDLNGVTGNYHSNGAALVICAGGVHTARRVLADHIAAEIAEAKYAEDSWATDFAANTDADWAKVLVFEVPKEREAQVYIFPNAGCC